MLPRTTDAEDLRNYYMDLPAGQPYSIPLLHFEKDGRSAVYRHCRVGNGELLKTLDPKVASKYATFPALGYRSLDPVTNTHGDYQWIDYQTLQKRRAHFGAGLVELHRRVGEKSERRAVGLWSQNRPEWQIADHGCQSQNLYPVSLYETLGPETTEYIINHTEQTCVITTASHIATLIKLKPRLPNVKILVSLDLLDEHDSTGPTKRSILSELCTNVGLKLYTIDEVEALGTSVNIPYNPPNPDDLITISYTSGTIGLPKGVILTHANAIAGVSGVICNTPKAFSGGVYFSYLPIAHIYERVGQLMALWNGAGIGVFHGDILELMDDMKALRPHVFPSVPRLWSRIGNAIRAETVQAPGLKGVFFRRMMEAKLKHLRQASLASQDDQPGITNAVGETTRAVYDYLFTSKIRKALGIERALFFATGSAPIDESLQKFITVATGTPVSQGYGLTETFSAGTITLPGDFMTGHCGGVQPSLEICLASIPDMGYFVTDKPFPRGEVYIRGNVVFQGYYRNEKDSAEAFTHDGWFMTGDVGSFDEMGRLSIIDRRKNLLKLAQGEYVSPEKIENLYLSAASYLAQCFVHGDSAQSHLVAIATIDPTIFAATVVPRALNTQIKADDLEALEKAAKNPRVIDYVLADLQQAGRKAKLAGFERAKNVALRVAPMTIEENFLTPTLKFKRSNIVRAFRGLLDELYATTPVNPSPKL